MPLSCRIYDRTKNILISHSRKARARNPKNPINQQPTTTYEFHKQILIFRVFFYWRPHSGLFRSHSLFCRPSHPSAPSSCNKNSALCFEKSNYKNWTLSRSLFGFTTSTFVLVSSGRKTGIPCYGEMGKPLKNIYSFFHPFPHFHIFPTMKVKWWMMNSDFFTIAMSLDDVEIIKIFHSFSLIRTPFASRSH